MFCGGRENGVYRSAALASEMSVHARMTPTAPAFWNGVRSPTGPRAGRVAVGNFSSVGCNPQTLVLFAPLTGVDRALEERDLALQTLEREGRIPAGKDQLAGDAGRRCLTRIRKIRRDRRLEGRAGRRCDGDLPPSRIPSRKGIASRATSTPIRFSSVARNSTNVVCAALPVYFGPSRAIQSC